MFGLFCMVLHCNAHAEGSLDEVYDFDVPQKRGDLALIEFAEQANRTLMFPFDEARKVRANRVLGRYTVVEGLRRLLKSTGLFVSVKEDGELEVVNYDGEQEMDQNTQRSWFGRMGAGLAAFFVAGTGAAQESAPATAIADNPGAIEEVIVTARRREENSQDVPIPITAISSEVLQGRGITDIQNIERVAPNLSFRSNGIQRSAAVIFLRGIGQLNFVPSQDPKVGIYVDDVYVARPQGGLFDLLDVEQVEVLRGPQGTLFGRNTTAGLVHVRTGAPSDEFEARFSAGFGNQGQIGGDLLLNVPFSDTLAGRIAVQTREDDGYMRDRSGRAWNTTNSTSARGKLLWTPAENVDVTFAAELYRARETASLANCTLEAGALFNSITGLFGALGDLERACADDGDVFLSNDNDPNELDVDNYSYSLTVNWDVGDIGLTSISSYREITEFNASWGYGTDFVGGPSFHLERGGPPGVDSDYEQWSQEFRIEGGAFDDRLAWQTGVYLFEEEGTQITEVAAWRGLEPPDNPFLAPIVLGARALFTLVNDQRAKNESFALFAEGTFDVTDQLAVTAGWRWTEDKRGVELRDLLPDGVTSNPLATCQGVPVPAGGSCDGDDKYNESTWRLIVDYNFTDDVLLYGGVSRGYSSGGINADANLRPYLPEVSDNYELGMKSQWLDNRLQVNLSAFYTDYENQQVLQAVVVNGQAGVEILNAQETTIQGIELEAQANLGSGLLLTLAAGYIDSEFDKFIFFDSDNELVDGRFVEVRTERDVSNLDALPESPFSYSVGLSKEFVTGQSGVVTAQIGYSFRDRIYNTLDRREESRQDSFGLLDARVGLTLPNGRTNVSIWGTNLTDEEHFRFASDTGSTLGVIAKYYAEPRRYGVSLTHSLAP